MLKVRLINRVYQRSRLRPSLPLVFRSDARIVRAFGEKLKASCFAAASPLARQDAVRSFQSAARRGALKKLR
jgi:hypothetical protein